MIPAQTYVKVCAALLLLTLTTVGLAFVDLGAWNTPVALTIAVSKAALIMLFFMELKIAQPIERLTAGAGLLWLSILLIGTLDDYLTRTWLTAPGK